MRCTDKFGTFRTTSGGPSVDAAEVLLLPPLPPVVLPVDVEEGVERVMDAAVDGMADEAVGGEVELS